MPFDALLFTLKGSTASGCAGGTLNIIYQVIRNACCGTPAASAQQADDLATSCTLPVGARPPKLDGDDDEEELPGAQDGRKPALLTPAPAADAAGPSISVAQAIDSFAVCAVLGAVGCPAVWFWCLGGRENLYGTSKAVTALCVSEAVWAPLVACCIVNDPDDKEDYLPTVFSSTVTTVGIAELACAGVNQFGLLRGTTAGFITGRNVGEMLLSVGAPSCGWMLLLFSWRFAELQRKKTLLVERPRVRRIQRGASYAGQGIATFCAGAAMALPWLGDITRQAWAVPGLIISPIFLYCTALNVENGVNSKELQVAMSSESADEMQTRRSTMQILPVGLLPFAWTKGVRGIPAVVKLGLGGMALTCAALYIGCQSVPWIAYIDAEREARGGVFDEGLLHSGNTVSLMRRLSTATDVVSEDTVEQSITLLKSPDKEATNILGLKTTPARRQSGRQAGQTPRASDLQRRRGAGGGSPAPAPALPLGGSPRLSRSPTTPQPS